MAATDTEVEKSGYGFFERFLLFFIPVVFTAVLTIVLLTMFNYNVMGQLKEWGNTVPLVKYLIPDTAVTPNGTAEGGAGTDQSELLSNQLKELQSQLKAAQVSLQQAETASKTKDEQIKELNTQIAQLQEQTKNRAINQEAYQQNIQRLANVYAAMNPGKAAPLMENLTLSEQVLVLGSMKEDSQVSILEKMDPAVAAEASIMLKDRVQVADRQIAALQERLAIQDTQNPTSGNSAALSIKELSETFASMDGASASTLLLQMYTLDPSKVSGILKAMTAAQRSTILTSMAEESPTTAAQLSAGLAE